jgi:hypothetical protein
VCGDVLTHGDKQKNTQAPVASLKKSDKFVELPSELFVSGPMFGETGIICRLHQRFFRSKVVAYAGRQFAQQCSGHALFFALNHCRVQLIQAPEKGGVFLIHGDRAGKLNEKPAPRIDLLLLPAPRPRASK